MTAPADAIAAALQRNDLFLSWIETHDFCPFARRCRETGALERRVLLGDSPTPQTLLPLLRELADKAFTHVEVALLIFPEARVDRASFERLVTQTRTLREREEPRPTFFMVAFHPDSLPHADTPARAVSLLRRSPDPTIQLVRAELLRRIRGPDGEETIFVDPKTMDLSKPVVRPPPGLSSRIAQANFETVQREGPEKVVADLSGFRRR